MLVYVIKDIPRHRTCPNAYGTNRNNDIIQNYPIQSYNTGLKKLGMTPGWGDNEVTLQWNYIYSLYIYSRFT